MMRLHPKPQPVRGSIECKHGRVICKLEVSRFDNPGTMAADIRIECPDCNVPFRFKGLPVGVSITKTMVSINGEELRAVIEPAHVEALMKDSGI